MKKFEEINTQLEKELDPSLVKKRPHDGFDYIEGHTAIDIANEIFGFDGWDCRVQFDLLREYSIPASKSGAMRGIVSVPVEIQVNYIDGKDEIGTIVKTDVGTCIWSGQDQIETALKGAVTDGMKRCLRQFGKRFGNDLYKTDEAIVNQSASYQPRAVTQPSVEQPSNAPTCDSCGSKMVLRNGKFGPFWGCSNYPTCKRLVNPQDVDSNGNIVKKEAKKEDPQVEEEINIEDIEI